jgi:hypothetical protein
MKLKELISLEITFDEIPISLILRKRTEEI